MRINSINLINLNKNYNVQNSKCVDKKENFEISNDIRNFPVLPMNYFVSFRGYDEDKQLIKASINSLNITIDNVIDYYDQGNYIFEKAIDLLEEKSFQDYKTLISRPEMFKLYQQKYTVFDMLTLNSIRQVYNDSDIKFNKFWQNNAKIGKTKISNIIKESVDPQYKDGVNDLLKSLDSEQFENVENNIIVKWFQNELKNNPKPQLELINKENERILKTISKRQGETPNSLEISLKMKYYNDFKSKTIEPFLNDDLSYDERITGFNNMIGYLGFALKSLAPDDLQKSLHSLSKIQQQLDKGKGQETIAYLNDVYHDLYNTILLSWEKNELPYLLNSELKKMQVIDNVEQNYPKITSLLGYSELPLNEKYFVANYYDLRDEKLMLTDFLANIVKDRNIENPAPIISLIDHNIAKEKFSYLAMVDNFNRYILNEELEQENEHALREKVQSSSLIDEYLKVSGKADNYMRKTFDQQVRFLKSLTPDELLLISDKVKEDWLNIKLKTITMNEVRRQSHLSDINQKMYKELCKININLDDIKIELKNINVTLKDLLDGRAVINNPVDANKFMKNSLSTIENMEREYEYLSAEEKADVDVKLKEALIKIADGLEKTAKTDDLKNELANIKKASANPKTKSNELFRMMKFVAFSQFVGQPMRAGFGALKSVLSNHTNLANMGHQVIASLGIGHHAANATQAASLVDVSQMDVASDGVGTAVDGTAQAFGIDPVTLAIVGGVILLSKTVMGYKNAKTLEIRQRPLQTEIEL